jgi:hypothetical protein
MECQDSLIDKQDVIMLGEAGILLLSQELEVKGMERGCKHLLR